MERDVFQNGNGVRNNHCLWKSHLFGRQIFREVIDPVSSSQTVNETTYTKSYGLD